MSQTRSQMNSLSPFINADTGCGLENTLPSPEPLGFFSGNGTQPAFTLVRFSSSLLRGYPHCTAPLQELAILCCLTCISTAASAPECLPPSSSPPLSQGRPSHLE